MKYSVFTLFAVAAAFVAAAPTDKAERAWIEDRLTHSISGRQASGGAPSTVPVNEAAMTDANGNIVPFNTAGVYQANKEAGL
ncbi:hypothetical protein Ct61P_00577 [Colletotrichum tofieldiae]|nr:hypothetical protein Ct61P_00577 [Colletotrichum tofieldiae]